MRLFELFNKEKFPSVKTLSVPAIAKKHNVSARQIQKQLKMGIKVEQEHTTDKNKAKEIALDHLAEHPDYYTRLKSVEEDDTLELPDIEVGDEVKIGKWKNRKATVKGFKKDKKDNHPVLKTTKGDTKLFKPRISKIEEAKYNMTRNDLIDNFVNLWSTGDEWGDTVGTLFDVAIELYKRGEGPPYDWDFRPGAGMKMYRDSPPRPKNFRQDPNEEGNPELRYADTASLEEFGELLRTKRDRLEAEGKSY